MYLGPLWVSLFFNELLGHLHRFELFGFGALAADPNKEGGPRRVQNEAILENRYKNQHRLKNDN